MWNVTAWMPVANYANAIQRNPWVLSVTGSRRAGAVEENVIVGAAVTPCQAYRPVNLVTSLALLHSAAAISLAHRALRKMCGWTWSVCCVFRYPTVCHQSIHRGAQGVFLQDLDISGTVTMCSIVCVTDILSSRRLSPCRAINTAEERPIA
ncbi:hypothetical protein BD309DRAFT_193226 [Dichomitus squalens]|nr:hypothetical protein BD309DRAFT_193226 [Dichomitus squalens]